MLPIRTGPFTSAIPAAIQYHAVGFVAQQAGAPAGVKAVDDIGGHVDDAGLGAGGLGNHGENLVPGEPFVGRDVESFAQRAAVAEQTDKTPGKVLVMGHCPERAAVAMGDDFLTLTHAIDNRIAAVHGEEGLVVGVRRPYDRHGKTIVPVSLQEPFFTGNFVARIGPIDL
jgi:hypothetical protein